MKTIFRIITLVLLALFSYGAVVDAFGAKETGIFNFADYFPFGAITFFTITSFYLDYSYYKIAKNKLQLLPSVMGCIVCFSVAIKLCNRNSIDKSKELFNFSHNGSVKEASYLSFKVNNNFTLATYDLLSSTTYYGKYSQKGDTITLLDIMNNPYLKQLPATSVVQQDKIYFKGLDTLELVK